MKTLLVLDLEHEISSRAERFLLQAKDDDGMVGAIYWCDEHNAYHLNPEFGFTLDVVEFMLNDLNRD